MKIKKEQPLVSYVITVKNGARFIGRTLQGIKNQTYPNIEVIVVDNHSTDGTREIAKRYGAKVFLRGPERAAQLAYSLKMARGKYYFSTGCDLVADKDYIEKAVRACEEKGYDAIYTSVISEANNFWSRAKGLDRLCHIGDDAHEAARFLRRDVFLKIGGFDGSLKLYGDDLEVQARLDKMGCKTGRINALETHIDEITSPKEVFLKSFYYGCNSKRYIQKYPTHSLMQLHPFRKVFLKNWRLLAQHPFLSLGLVVLKTVKYSSATVGLLFAFMGKEKIAERFHQAIYRKRER